MRRNKRGSLKPEQSSIIINIMPVMQSRGIKFPYAFLMKLGLSSTSVNNILQGNARQINTKQLTKICVALNCEPNHLFELRDMDLPPNHALHVLPKVTSVSEIMPVEEYLGNMSVEEARAILKRKYSE